MKNKKELIIILILVIVIVVGVLYFTLKDKEYVIPDGYKLILKYSMSHVDGTDITYYVYENRIIADSIENPTYGTPYESIRTVIEYNDIYTENINTVQDVRDLIKDIEGKERYKHIEVPQKIY